MLRSSSRVIPPDSLLKFGYSPNGGIEFDSSDSVLNISYSGTPKARFSPFGMALPDGEGLVVGHSSQLTIAAVVPEVQVLGTADGVDATVAIGGFGTGVEPRLVLTKARGTISTPSAGQNGDNHGEILWVGHDGTDFANTNLAKIHAIADGSGVADSDSAGALIFSTTPNGAGAAVEALRIDRSQNVGIGAVSGGARLEVVDSGIAGSTVFKVTQDDQNPYGIIVGNDSFSVSDVEGMALYVTDGGISKIRALGTGGVLQFGTPANSSYMQLDNSGMLSLGDISNSGMNVGLTINQGAYDDEILALKSSDVAHGRTSLTETDTFGRVTKASSAGGGIAIWGISELVNAAFLYGSGETEDLTDTSTSEAAVEIQGRLQNASLNSAGNVFAVANQSTTRLLVKGNGDLHITNTTLTALDDEDDIALVRAYQRESSNGMGIAMTKWDKHMHANAADLRRVGVWSSENDFTIQQRMNDLLGGAIWQQHTQHMSLVERVDSLTRELKEANKQLAALSAPESD